MNRSHKTTSTLATLVAATALSLLAAGTARADCVGGVRAATQAELEFAARARAALLAALPAEPANIEWRGKRPDFSEPPRLDFCKGTAIGAFTPSVVGSWLYQFPAAEAEHRARERRELQKQIEALEALPPDKDAQRKALLDQMRAAYDAAPRRSRKDPPLAPEQQALADKQQAEGRRLEEQANKVAFDHRASVKPQTDPLRARADALQQGPQTLAAQLRINATTLPEAAGSAAASFGAPSAKQSVGLTVHNVILQVDGPDGAARDALFAAFDRAYLQGLVGKPLPDVAASQARSAGVMAAAPATAAEPGRTTAPPTSPAARRDDRPGKPEPAGATAQDAAGARADAACAPKAGGAPVTPAADAGAEVGAKVLGGGHGRQVGAAIGGLLGALGGAAKKPEPANADCPR